MAGSSLNDAVALIVNVIGTYLPGSRVSLSTDRTHIYVGLQRDRLRRQRQGVLNGDVNEAYTLGVSGENELILHELYDLVPIAKWDYVWIMPWRVNDHSDWEYVISNKSQIATDLARQLSMHGLPLGIRLRTSIAGTQHPPQLVRSISHLPPPTTVVSGRAVDIFTRPSGKRSARWLASIRINNND